MLPGIKKFINQQVVFLRWESEDHELLQSISHKVMGTTISAYMVFYFLATMGWPRLFSPSLFLISLVMIATAGCAWFLLVNYYLLAQIIWFLGLGVSIILGFYFYKSPDILFFFAFIPLMTEVMLGMVPTYIVEGVIIVLAFFWNSIPFLPPLNAANQLAVVVVTLVTLVLGWGILNNLISSIEAASYHYNEALRNLNEAREHRAEISVLLKDVNRANYQLENLNHMLIYARAQADELREERDRFALAVSHELRSPLNFIIGFSDLMVNSPETYARITDWPHGLYDDINEIYKSSTHLMSLINDILDMGKMDAQQMVLFKEKIDFTLVIEDVRQMVHSAVESKGLQLKVEIQPDLPLIYVDRTRIRQVLLNLVTNSLRFTRKGSITLRAYMLKPEILKVEVIDSGVGISKSDQPKVFKEFRQVGNQNWQRGEGSGLGLSIGRRFVQMHGGDMGLESEPGKGSTFFFTLPIQQQVDSFEKLDHVEEKNSQENRRLLIDEKQPALLFLSHDAFSARVFAESMQGVKATLMTDPSQLYTAVASAYPRSVIIDQPLFNDLHVQKFLKNPPYDVPVFIFSIPLSRQNRSSNLPDGVNDYLVKPVPRQVMIETIAQLNINPHTVLVVDDDPSMSRFVTQALKTNEEDIIKLPEDLNILPALDGQEALRFLQALPIGVMLLDLDLSDMNGLTLLNQMRQDSTLRKIPVVIISASDPPATFEPQVRGEFSIYVNRSFSSKELNDMLNISLKQISPTFTQVNYEENGETTDDVYSDSGD
jgi:signal transduction histidine kinase/CheY-like chemotaxis protein